MPTYTYPRPMLTVDIAIFQQCGAQVQVLLIQRGQNPCAGSWALPGGFVNMDETLEQSAVRELEEETGLVVPDLEQVHTYGDPGRDPRGRVISVAYTALLEGSAELPLHASSDAEAAGWFPTADLPELAFDHQQIIQDAYELIKVRLA